MDRDVLRTARLDLVPATRELLGLDLARPQELARRLEAELPADWPPGSWDVPAASSIRDRVDDARAGWWTRYVVLRGPPRVLAGVAGFHGPPRDGVGELGYSVAEAYRGTGIATEATEALLGWAFDRGARAVVAETEVGNGASRRVLEKVGMTLRSREGDVVRYGIRSPGSRGRASSEG